MMILENIMFSGGAKSDEKMLFERRKVIWRLLKGPDEERNMEWSIFQTAAGPGELNFQD